MNCFQTTLRIKVSKDFDIQNIAKLASINLSEDEQEKLAKDLSIILEHVKALSDLELNTEQNEIYIHPLEKELELQEDELVESLTHEEALSNAPESKDGKFVVPPSME
jgi:aspartyl-tRNA(Asn)/glutamyl-tRNA(Gln) amidotransferase subunit C